MFSDKFLDSVPILLLSNFFLQISPSHCYGIGPLYQPTPGGYFQPMTPAPAGGGGQPCTGPFCSAPEVGPDQPFFPTPAPFPADSPEPEDSEVFPPVMSNTLPPFSGPVPTLFPIYPGRTNAPPSNPNDIPPDRQFPSSGSGYGRPSYEPSNAASRADSANLLSVKTADFLSTLTKEQLVAFFRAFFMSQSMGTSVLDSQVPISRSLMPVERHVVEVARAIPAAAGNMQTLEQTRLGKILGEFARKVGTASGRERGSVRKTYQHAISELRLPKGIKYALRQIQI